VRIITNSLYDEPAEPPLNNLRLPSVNEMTHQESASMVYKVVNNQTPIYLTTLFNRVSKEQTHDNVKSMSQEGDIGGLGNEDMPLLKGTFMCVNFWNFG